MISSLDETHDRDRKSTDGKNNQQSDNHNRDDSQGGNSEQRDFTRPVMADTNKLLQPSLARNAKNDAGNSAFKSYGKLPGDFPRVVLADNHSRGTGISSLRSSDLKPPVSSKHEQIELDHGEHVSEKVESLSLNQARATLAAIRGDLRLRGYNPEERVLGYGTEANNPHNPFVKLADLYNPNPQSTDFLKLREAKQQGQVGQQSAINNLASFDQLFKREEAMKTNLLIQLQEVSDGQLLQEEREAAIGFTLSNAAPEQQRQNEQLQSIKQRPLEISLELTKEQRQKLTPEERQQYEERQAIKREAALEARLKSPLEKLTAEQQRVYRQSQEILLRLRTDDLIAEHIDELQAEYKRNDWQEDSHWYGLDDKKFLQDIQSRNLYHVSDYDKFRALATIESIKTQNIDTVANDLNKLTPEQRQLREMIDGKVNESTGKNEPGLEHDIRTQLVERWRHEVNRLDMALVSQLSKQGLVTNNVVDPVISLIGKPGGWGKIFMDSDATSRSANANLERARQASQNLLALSEFKGNNLEFAKAYQARVKELDQALQKTGDNLNKMADAHHGRVEGISDIAQVTAGMSAILGCASAAPETCGGSLAAIPIAASMAAGAAGKVVTKLLESETTATGKAYTVPHILQDAAIAAITSALPGNRIAKPLLQAESMAIKQVAVAEGKQLAMQATTAAIEQVGKATGREFSVQAASKLLVEQMRQRGSNLVKELGELTPRAAVELTVKYTSQTGKRIAGYSLACGIDGATIQGTGAVIKGEDPLEASVQGFVGGAILGPVVAPAVKHGGALAKKGIDWLRTKTETTVDNALVNAARAADAARKAKPAIKSPSERDIDKLYKAASSGGAADRPQQSPSHKPAIRAAHATGDIEFIRQPVGSRVNYNSPEVPDSSGGHAGDFGKVPIDPTEAKAFSDFNKLVEELNSKQYTRQRMEERVKQLREELDETSKSLAGMDQEVADLERELRHIADNRLTDGGRKHVLEYHQQAARNPEETKQVEQLLLLKSKNGGQGYLKPSPEYKSVAAELDRKCTENDSNLRELYDNRMKINRKPTNLFTRGSNKAELDRINSEIEKLAKLRADLIQEGQKLFEKQIANMKPGDGICISGRSMCMMPPGRATFVFGDIPAGKDSIMLRYLGDEAGQRVYSLRHTLPGLSVTGDKFDAIQMTPGLRVVTTRGGNTSHVDMPNTASLTVRSGQRIQLMEGFIVRGSSNTDLSAESSREFVLP